MKKRFFQLLVLLGGVCMTVNAQTWTHAGPFKDNAANKQPGRVDGIVFHPSFHAITNPGAPVYASSFSGGIWVNNNILTASSNWLEIRNYDNTPSGMFSGVAHLAVDQVNNQLYVADYNTAYAFPMIDVDPTYYLANFTAPAFRGNRSNKKLYKYDVASGSWSQTGLFNTTPDPKFRIWRVYLHPNNVNWIYVCCTDGVYRSQNGGLTWSLVHSGETMEMLFINTGSNIDILISGKNSLAKFSTMNGDALSWNNITALTNMWSTQSLINDGTIMSHVKAANGNHLVYFYTAGNINSQATDSYNLYKYNYTTGTLTHLWNDPAINHGNVVTYDRLGVAALKEGIIICGGTNMRTFREPSTSAWVPTVHDDIHECLRLPGQDNVMYNSSGTLYGVVGCDGGVYLDTYTYSSTTSSHSFAVRNVDLNIAAVNGFGQAELDNSQQDVYITGEQDFNAGSFYQGNTLYSFPVTGEHQGGLIDRFDPSFNRVFKHSSSYAETVTSSETRFGAGTLTAEAYYASSTLDMCTHVTTDGQVGGKTMFGTNALHQDPYRPDRIFWATSYISQYCKSAPSVTGRFKVRFRHSIIFQMPTVDYNRAEWFHSVTDMAFSKQNKDILYFTTVARYSAGGCMSGAAGRGQIFKFSGPPNSFEQQWIDHNEANNWTEITPMWNSSSTIITSPANQLSGCKQDMFINYMGIACSEVDPHRVYAAVSEVPKNSGIKVIRYENGVWTNYSNNLPVDEVPITLEYEQGTNDAMYLGTNEGIWYTNRDIYPTSGWISYQADLPKLAINAMNINYGKNEINVSAYGKGIWNAPLICPQTSLLVSGPMSYTSSTFKEHTTITTNGTVTAANHDVRYRATDYIDLNTDFTASSAGSSLFWAYIHKCNGEGNSFRNAEEDPASASYYEDEELDEPEVPQNDIVVFPNPNNGTFTVLKQADATATVTLYDLSGRIVLRETAITGERMEFRPANIKPGVYLLKAMINNEPVVKRIIIN